MAFLKKKDKVQGKGSSEGKARQRPKAVHKARAQGKGKPTAVLKAKEKSSP